MDEFFAFYKRLIYFQRNARYLQLHTSIFVFTENLKSNSTMVEEENKVLIPFPIMRNINKKGETEYFKKQIIRSKRFCEEDWVFLKSVLFRMTRKKENYTAVTTAELYALAFIIFINMKRLEMLRTNIEGNLIEDNAFDTINRYFKGYYIFDFETGKNERNC